MRGIEGIRIGRITSGASGIEVAETSEEITDQTTRLIEKSRESVRILTQNPGNYCKPLIASALLKAIEKKVHVEMIGVNDELHREDLRSLASLGVSVFGVSEWPRRGASSFTVVDEKDCQVEERHLPDQEPKRVYFVHNRARAPELVYEFESVKENATLIPQIGLSRIVSSGISP